MIINLGPRALYEFLVRREVRVNRMMKVLGIGVKVNLANYRFNKRSNHLQSEYHVHHSKSIN
jgi:hypothetical protein